MKSLVVGIAALFLVVIVLVRCKSKETIDSTLLRVPFTNQQQDDGATTTRQLLPRVKQIGNNPSKPLGLCEGDCDNDDDCQGDLVCFQRGRRQPIPGCSGNPSNKADFCIKKPSSNGDDNDGGGENGGGGSSGGGGGGSFLKMYWEREFYWQEEWIERKWCMKCDPGCEQGEKMVIVDCGESPTRLELIVYGSEVQIKLSGRDLCLQVNTSINRISLQGCSSTNDAQRFVSPNREDFRTASRFELSPKTKSGYCVTQRHHPRNREEVWIETCNAARIADTSYWMKY